MVLLKTSKPDKRYANNEICGFPVSKDTRSEEPERINKKRVEERLSL
jgi:hypothetical protein